jgi:hypothetical protein
MSYVFLVVLSDALYWEFWILPAVKSIKKNTTQVWRTRRGHIGLRGVWGSEYGFREQGIEVFSVLSSLEEKTIQKRKYLFDWGSPLQGSDEKEECFLIGYRVKHSMTGLGADRRCIREQVILD